MAGIVRKLVKLAVFLLIANALYRFVPPYVHYIQFRDAVRQMATFSMNVPDGELTDRIMSFAEQYSVPLDRDAVSIRHQQQQIFIDASYVQVIAFMPGYEYPWHFDVNAEARLFMPSRAGERR
jgi:type III secretion system FlhB-like substrate exporter